MDKTNSIVGINGIPINAIQIEVPLSFEDKNMASIFSVLNISPAISQIQFDSGIQIHGILGIPFLT